MKNILVLFGGRSSEHEISKASACSVIKNMDPDKYRLFMMGITRQGEWYLFEGEPEALLHGDEWLSKGPVTRAFLSPDSFVHGICVFRKGGIEQLKMDAVFPVLHGKNGEDGTVQGLLQLSGIPFVGCDTPSSALAMDKIYTNMVADKCGIAQAEWDFLTSDMYERGEKSPKEIAERLGFPLFVKPANSGSSVGISKVFDEDGLEPALCEAFCHDKRILFEEYIDGREVECAVLGNAELITGTVGQISPAGEFYDYAAKYEKAESRLHIPALISKEARERVAEYSVEIYRALGCRGFSRVDFFVAGAEERIFFNEINTIPGFTDISMYPKMMEHAGIGFGELCDRLIELAEEGL